MPAHIAAAVFGKLLMKAVAKEAQQFTGCGMIKWWVAKWNDRNPRFKKRPAIALAGPDTRSSMTLMTTPRKSLVSKDNTLHCRAY